MQVGVATPAFLLLLIPAGFVVGWSLDILAFRSRSQTEQIIWATSLSVPFGLVVASIFGRFLPASAIVVLLLVLDLICVVLLAEQWRGRLTGTLFPMDPSTRKVVLCLLLAVLYLWLASLPLGDSRHIYEPVFSSDWEIRLPLVRAALRDGVPPHNPFFTYRGQSPPIRYYYYWYGLCAAVGRFVHTSPRSLLVASSVYAMLGLIATLFLYLKYVVTSTTPLRARCGWLLLFCCVLSLDVLPNLLGLFLWRAHLRPEIEWWANDRSPGLPGAILFGPHHVAGVACGLLGFLSVITVVGLRKPLSASRTAAHALLTAVCFSALVGTSTFIAIFFVTALVMVSLDALRRRDYAVLWVLLGATVVSLALSIPFLRESTAKTVVAHGNGIGRHPLQFALRADNQVQAQLFFGARHFHVHNPTGPVRFLNRAALILVHYIIEVGFFLFVFALQFRRDVLVARLQDPKTRAFWMLAVATAIYFFFVTSAPIQTVNDLGVHAGLLLRVIGILWATQVVPEYLTARKAALPSFKPAPRWATSIATLFFAVGLLTAVWQAAIERTYLVLVDRHMVRASLPFPQGDHIAAIYHDVFAAQSAAAHMLPPDAVVQSNPISRYGPLFRLYQQRRQAAGDLSCEGSFGGDPDLCQSFVPDILGLFGVHAKPASGQAAPPINPQASTPGALAQVCAADGISAVLASRADPVWYQPESWVWQGHLLYGNGSVRVIGCPGV